MRRAQPFLVLQLALLAATPLMAQERSPDPEQASAPSDPQPAAKSADGISIGGFKFTIGGRIKLDVIRDFTPIGSTDTFDPRTIPVDGSEGNNSRIHARESRLALGIAGPAEGRELRLYLEGDFYGSGNAFRLRHAYVSYGGLLAGQTWSTFMDEDNLPNTIDFETPTAYAFVRQGQVRWTQKLSNWVSWSAAIEDSASEIVPPDNVPGRAEYPMPDLVTRLRFTQKRGHEQISGFLGRARFRPAAGTVDDETLWGVLLSARFTPVGRDAAYAQVTFGDGIGRYRGAVTAVPDVSGHLRALHVAAVTSGYEHYWSERVSSNGVYGIAWADNAFAGLASSRRIDYGAVNLLYWFLKDRAWAGVEYLYGRREQQDEQSGTAHRIQFGIRVNLPR